MDDTEQKEAEMSVEAVAKRPRAKKADGIAKATRKKKVAAEGNKDHRMFITNLSGLMVVNKGLKLLKKNDDLTEAETKAVDNLLGRIAERLG